MSLLQNKGIVICDRSTEKRGIVMKKRIKQLIIVFTLFVISFVLLVVMGQKVSEREISYEPVKVTVVSAQTVKERTPGTTRRHNAYHVVVEYEGACYDLINVQSGEMPRYEGLANLKPELQHDNPYLDNTVYFSGGNMYSNVAGIRTDTALFDWKMIGLCGVWGFGILSAMLFADIIDKKRRK